MRDVLAREGTIHLGGISAGDAAHGHTPEAAAKQAEAVFDALEARLGSVGAKLTDLCKMTMQITDRAYRQAVYGVMGRRLAGVKPVSTGIIVNGLHDPHALFQLDAFAVPGGPHDRIRPYKSTSMPYGRDWQPFVAEFCMAVRTKRQVFLRGQVGATLDGKMVGDNDPQAQATQALDNVETLLGDAGCRLADAAFATVYVTDRAFIAPVMRALLPRLTAHGIPHTLFVVKGLASPELQMEVDVHAVRPDVG